MKDFAHQEEAFQRFKMEQYGALFHEQGCGKTRVAIRLAEYHFLRNDITAVFMVTTTGLVGNWSEVELPMHSTIEYNQFRWNTDKKMPKAGPLYFMINIDALISSRFIPAFREFFETHRRFMLIVDESTIAKNPKAKRTKRLQMVANVAKYRFIMSGTPLVHSPLDLFSQCALLKPEVLGVKSMWAFKARYAVEEKKYNGPRHYSQVTGFKNLPELTAKLNVFASIVKKKDCLDIPDKIYRKVYVPFTTEQATAYNELRTRALTYIQENEITVANAVALINKLLQISCGQLKVGDDYLSIPNHRLALVKELVEECEGKTIIWTSFVNSARDVCTALGDLALALPSGLSLTARADVLRAYKTGPKRALVANPASAGHGITLTESSNMIYYSNSWNYEHRVQSEDRAHRIGQTEHLLITDLNTRGTVEDRVLRILRNKELMANTVITNQFIKELLNEQVRLAVA